MPRRKLFFFGVVKAQWKAVRQRRLSKEEQQSSYSIVLSSHEAINYSTKTVSRALLNWQLARMILMICCVLFRGEKKQSLDSKRCRSISMTAVERLKIESTRQTVTENFGCFPVVPFPNAFILLYCNQKHRTHKKKLQKAFHSKRSDFVMKFNDAI